MQNLMHHKLMQGRKIMVTGTWSVENGRHVFRVTGTTLHVFIDERLAYEVPSGEIALAIISQSKVEAVVRLKDVKNLQYIVTVYDYGEAVSSEVHHPPIYLDPSNVGIGQRQLVLPENMWTGMIGEEVKADYVFYVTGGSTPMDVLEYILSTMPEASYSGASLTEKCDMAIEMLRRLL